MIGRVAVLVLGAAVVGGAIGMAGCSPRRDEPEKGNSMTQRSIEEVLKENTDEWMAVPGVEGTAIGLLDGKPCIKVFSSRPVGKLQGTIPSVVEGYPVAIEQTGAFRALEPQ